MKNNHTTRNSEFSLTGGRTAGIRWVARHINLPWRNLGNTANELAVPPCKQRTGFSLVEVLLAIGILAVGMGLVAAVFPAAVKENVGSTSSSLGAVICENGLAIIKTRCTTSAHLPTTVSDTDRLYAPYWDAAAVPPQYRSKYGFAYLVVQPPGLTGNDFIVIIAATRVSDEKSNEGLIEAIGGGTFADLNDASIFKPSSATAYANIKTGTPIITIDGNYAIARMVDQANDRVILDRRVDARTVTAAYTVTEANKSTNATIAGISDSPSIGVLVTRTSLRN